MSEIEQDEMNDSLAQRSMIVVMMPYRTACSAGSAANYGNTCTPRVPYSDSSAFFQLAGEPKYAQRVFASDAPRKSIALNLPQ